MTEAPDPRDRQHPAAAPPTGPAEIIGHRGSPREAPENTLASFERALSRGVDAIELDTHATSDGVVVVHHDPVMGLGEHPAIAGKAITSLSWSQLHAARRDDSSAAPRLADVLDLVGSRAVAYIELKGPHIEELVIACIDDSRSDSAVHAFDHRAVARVRTLKPELRTGILLEARLVDPVAAMREAGATDFWQQWKMIDEDLVTAIHDAGGRVIAWTVNDRDIAASLLAMGVDALCSDLPDIVQRLTSTQR